MSAQDSATSATASPNASFLRVARACPQRIAFHVAAHRQEMVVVLDEKALVTLLIDMPLSARVVMGVTPL